MIISCWSCKRTTPQEKVLAWYEETKEKILEQSGIKPDSVFEYIDLNTDLREKRTYYKGRIHEYTVADNTGAVQYDALYAEDTDFAIVREYCSRGQLTYEGIEYKHKPYGLATWYYCENGAIMEQGIRCKFKKLGTWKEHNPDGSVKTTHVLKGKIKLKSFPGLTE